MSDEGGHRFTLTEAAEACGVSRDTIKRRRAAGRFPNAAKDAQGAWRIPVGDLLADGLHPNAARPTQPEGEPQGHALSPPQDGRVRELEAEVRMLRAVLDERERALQIAERALAALPAPAAEPAPMPQAPQPAPARPRRWWHRQT